MKRTTTNADALARLLDGDPTVEDASGQLRSLAALARTMEGRAVLPEADFKECLRVNLLELAPTDGPVPLLLRLRVSWECALERLRYSTRTVAATALAALALTNGGVAAAAGYALPGQPLYGLKLALVDVQMLFVRDEAARGERLLVQALERVDEARMVADAGAGASAGRALRAADEDAREGARLLLTAVQAGDGEALDTLATFVADARARATFAPLLQADAADALADFLVTLDRIEARVAALTLGCPGCAPVEGDALALVPSAPVPGVPLPGAAFDATIIPRADEPFMPCPCTPTQIALVNATLPSASSPPLSAGGASSAPAPSVLPPGTPSPTGAPTSPAGPSASPSEPPPSEPEPPPSEPEPPPSEPDRVVPEAPGPYDEVVDEVVRDVLDGLPGEGAAAAPAPGVDAPRVLAQVPQEEAQRQRRAPAVVTPRPPRPAPAPRPSTALAAPPRAAAPAPAAVPSPAAPTVPRAPRPQPTPLPAPPLPPLPPLPVDLPALPDA
jgi:hypothetical protein